MTAKDNAKELLPCPFCGSDPETNYPTNNFIDLFCKSKSCAMNPGKSGDKDVVIAAWNTRVQSAAQPAQGGDLGELIKFLDSIEGAGYGGMAEYEIARSTARALTGQSVAEKEKK